jgi:gas vesicle protein
MSVIDQYEALSLSITHAIARRIDVLQAELRGFPPTAPVLKVVNARGAVILEIAAPTNEAWNRYVDKVQMVRGVDPGLDLLFDSKSAVDAAYQKFLEAQKTQDDVLARIEAELRMTDTNVGHQVLSRRRILQAMPDSSLDAVKYDLAMHAHLNERTASSNALRDATDVFQTVLDEHKQLANDRFPDTKSWGDQAVDNVASDPWSMETARIKTTLRKLEDSIMPIRYQLRTFADDIRERSTMATAGELEAVRAQLAYLHFDMSNKFEESENDSEVEMAFAEELVTIRSKALLLEVFDQELDEWDKFAASADDVRTARVEQVNTLLDWKRGENDARRFLQRVGIRYLLLQTMIDLHRHLLVAKNLQFLTQAPYSEDTILYALLHTPNEYGTESCRPEHTSDDCVRRVLLWFAIPIQEADHQERSRLLTCGSVETRATLPSLHDAAAALLKRFKFRSLLKR